jgi:hypothetical protein
VVDPYSDHLRYVRSRFVEVSGVLRGHVRKTLLHKVPLMSFARQITHSHRYDDPGRDEPTRRTLA